MTSQYTQVAGKRQKTTRDAVKVVDQNEFFPGVGVVEYRPDGGAEDTLCYRYYNAGERVHGRTMEDWLRPAVGFSHAFSRTNDDLAEHADIGSSGHYPWDEASTPTERCKRRVRACFELLGKLGVKLWTLQDRDVAVEGDTVEETHHNLDDAVELIAELQLRAGVKPLWVAANLTSHARYSSGSATSPDAQVATCAGAQLRKCLDVCHKLGAENFAFRGAREGYACVLNTDLTRELHNYSRHLKMAAAYKERLGYRGQLLLETSGDGKRRRGENGDEFHRYDHDALSALCLLKHYNLDRNYKLSVAPGHQLYMASAYGALGSVEIGGRRTLPSINETTLLMKTVIEQGGMQPGGLNIGVDLPRQPADAKELAIAYVSYIDVYARGFRNAAKVVADGVFAKNLQQRYLSFHTGFGSRLANGEASLEDCDDQAKKQRVEVVPTSGRPQHWEAVFSRYM